MFFFKMNLLPFSTRTSHLCDRFSLCLLYVYVLKLHSLPLLKFKAFLWHQVTQFVTIVGKKGLALPQKDFLAIVNERLDAKHFDMDKAEDQVTLDKIFRITLCILLSTGFKYIMIIYRGAPACLIFEKLTWKPAIHQISYTEF